MNNKKAPNHTSLLVQQYKQSKIFDCTESYMRANDIGCPYDPKNDNTIGFERRETVDFEYKLK